jgi:hypothetical protein
MTSQKEVSRILTDKKGFKIMKLNKIALTILTVATCLTSLTPAYSCPDGFGPYERANMWKNLSTTGQKADKDIEKNTDTRSTEQDTAKMVQLVSKSTQQPIANQSIVITYTGTIFCYVAPCPQPVKEVTVKTNSEGVLLITITVAGFQSKILPEDLHKQTGVTKIELSINP